MYFSYIHFIYLEADKDTELSGAFPQTNYVTMSNADTGKILGKLKDFNDNVTGDGLRLSDNQFQQISELVNGNTNNLETKLNLLLQLLQWPTGMFKKKKLFFLFNCFFF